MIRLSNTTEKLQAVLAGAVTTNQLHCVVCYSDDNGTTYTGGTQYTSTNNTTAVDICAAPGASTVRDIDYLSIRNRDTAAAIVTVMIDVSATDSELVKATLAVGDSLVYSHGNGWNAVDSSGQVKSSASGTVTLEGGWTDYSATSTIVGWSSFTTKQIYYKDIGKTRFVTFQIYGTSNSATTTFTLPDASSNTVSVNCAIRIIDNGAEGAIGLMGLSANSNTVTCYKSLLAAWTTSGTKLVGGQFTYQLP